MTNPTPTNPDLYEGEFNCEFEARFERMENEMRSLLYEEILSRECNYVSVLREQCEAWAIEKDAPAFLQSLPLSLGYLISMLTDVQENYRDNLFWRLKAGMLAFFANERVMQRNLNWSLSEKEALLAERDAEIKSLRADLDRYKAAALPHERICPLGARIVAPQTAPKGNRREKKIEIIRRIRQN